MNKKFILTLLLSILTAALISVKAYQSTEFATWIYGSWIYYLILTLFLVWAGTLYQYLRDQHFSWSGFLCKFSRPLIAAALLTALVFYSVQPRFRVLSDETNLLSVSQSMLYSKSAFNPTMNKNYFGSVTPLTAELEKRPMMFPFFIHLVHLAVGYHYQNVFILNGITLFCLLSLLGVCAQLAVGRGAVIPTLLLVGACPLVSSLATSGGFDLFATLFTAVLFVLLFNHLKKPTSANFGLLWITSILFCNIRYESFVIVGIVMLGIVLARAFKFAYLVERPLVFIATPILMIPLITQRILIPHPYENPPGVSAFSVDHFIKFFRILVDSQSDLNFYYPYPILLNWAAFPILLFVIYRLSHRSGFGLSQHAKKFLAILSLSVLISLLLFLCYYFGDYSHPASARFFVIISIIAALMPIWLHWAEPRRFNRHVLLLFSITLFVLYHPISVRGQFTQIQTLIRETEQIYSYLESHPVRDRLTIYSRPGQISALNMGAVDFGYANSHVEQLKQELSRHLYREMLVVQRMSYQTLAPHRDDQLSPEFELDTLDEIQTQSNEYLRISRVRVPSPKPEL